MSKHTDARAAVPAGWQLVPVEPTEEMRDAGLKAAFSNEPEVRDQSIYETTKLGAAYRAMLSASPSSPNIQGEGPDFAAGIDAAAGWHETWMRRGSENAAKQIRKLSASPKSSASGMDFCRVAVEQAQGILARYITPPGPYDFARADACITELLGVLDAQELVLAMRSTAPTESVVSPTKQEG